MADRNTKFGNTVSAMFNVEESKMGGMGWGTFCFRKRGELKTFFIYADQYFLAKVNDFALVEPEAEPFFLNSEKYPAQNSGKSIFL